MKKIIFLGLLSFLIAAIWQAPLAFVKPYAEKSLNNLKLEGVNGTVWNGSVQRLVNNNLDLGGVSWKVNPLKSLASLSLKAAFTINGKQLTADGIAALTPGTTIVLDNTNFEMDAATLNQFQKQANLSGELQGVIQHAEFTASKEKQLPVIKADIDWKQGAVNSMLLKLPPGDYHFIISPDENGLLIKPSSSEAPLELSGVIHLSKDWVYQPDLKVKSKDRGISGLLKLAGKAQPDGSVLINKSLDLKPFLNLK